MTDPPEYSPEWWRQKWKRNVFAAQYDAHVRARDAFIEIVLKFARYVNYRNDDAWYLDPDLVAGAFIFGERAPEDSPGHVPRLWWNGRPWGEEES